MSQVFVLQISVDPKDVVMVIEGQQSAVCQMDPSTYVVEQPMSQLVDCRSQWTPRMCSSR